MYTYQSVGRNITKCIWIVEARSGTEWDVWEPKRDGSFCWTEPNELAHSKQPDKPVDACEHSSQVQIKLSYHCRRGGYRQFYMIVAVLCFFWRVTMLSWHLPLTSVPPNGQFGPVYQSVIFFSTAVQILNIYTNYVFLFNQQKLQSAMAENRKSEERWKIKSVKPS